MSTNLNSQWQLFQSNGFTVNLNTILSEPGFTPANSRRRLFGSASFGETAGTVDGNASGTGPGSSVDFTVNWLNGSVGGYIGTFNNDLRLVGITFDRNNPSSSATWFSS